MAVFSFVGFGAYFFKIVDCLIKADLNFLPKAFSINDLEALIDLEGLPGVYGFSLIIV